MNDGVRWDADSIETLTGEIYRSAAVGRVDELRDALRHWSAGDDPRDEAVAGGAWLVMFKLSHDVAELDRALDHLRAAHAREPTPPRASNLASALLEWAWLPQRSDMTQTLAAHREAIALLAEAIDHTDREDLVWITRATTLLGAYADEIEGRLPGYDVGKTLDFGEEVVATTARLGVGGGEPANLLGNVLVRAADLGHARGDLDRAVGLLREAVATLAVDHPDRPARLSNLGSAFMSRYERTGAADDRHEAVRYHRLAYALATPNDLNRPLMANNLLNALCADTDITGDLALAREAAELAPVLSSAFRPGHPRRAVMLSNVALAQRLVGVLNDDMDMINAAIIGQGEAVASTAPDDPSRAGRIASLAVVLGDRYHRTGDPSDLDAALQAATQAVDAPGDVEHETVGFVSNLGNLHYDRFLLTGSIADLELAARLHLSGLESLPDGHPVTAALLNNAGIVLSDRYDRFGEASDLAVAIDVLDRALDGTAKTGRLRAGREVNLAVALNRRFTLTGDPRDVQRASGLARAARERARAARDRETAAAATSTLADSLRLRWEHLGDDDALSGLRELVEPEGADDPPTLAPARRLRRALLRRIVDGHHDTAELQAVIELGLESRPAVALAAARQLAGDALVARVRGDKGASAVAREAAAGASRALTSLLNGNQERRTELSWRRDAQGMAALAAQVALLDDDPTAALDAFESGHAVLLNRRVPREAHDAEHGGTDDELTVTAWTTPWGGGAVIAADGRVVKTPMLPRLTTHRVVRWTDRLAMSSRIGVSSLETVLARVLAELGDALAPVISCLSQDRPVVWCGGGLLSVLPVGAIASDGVPLGERATLRQASTPVFSRWSAARASRTPLDLGAALSIAEPAPSQHAALPGARLEGAAFAAPDKQLIGPRATTQDVLERIPAASLVHFAGHAFTSASDPLANHLLLADDAPLYAETIADLSLSGRLAVLSACDTAAVGVAHADEALGLTSGFHLAGVAGVVASLWPVRDRSTATFMRGLAEALGDGAVPAKAVRLARARARDHGLAASVWAAFVLSGA